MWFVSYEIEQSPTKGLNFGAMVDIFSILSPLADSAGKVAYLLKTISINDYINNKSASASASAGANSHNYSDPDPSHSSSHSSLGGVSPQLFIDLFVHMNSGIAPAEEVKLLGAEVWAGIARDASSSSSSSSSHVVGADKILGKFLSRYDLWAVLTAELVW